MGVTRIARQSTEISIAKEVMPAKREMKKISTKKQAIAEMELMNVDNFPIFTGNSETGNLRNPGRLYIEFTFQS